MKTGDPEVARLASAMERQNALTRLELILEMEQNPMYADNYATLIDTLHEMERDVL